MKRETNNRTGTHAQVWVLPSIHYASQPACRISPLPNESIYLLAVVFYAYSFDWIDRGLRYPSLNIIFNNDVKCPQ